MDITFGIISTDIASSTAVIPDATIYTSPARSALAVFLELWKMDKDGEETPLSISNSTPETVTQWSFTYNDDGWYKARMYVIEEFSIIDSYDEDDVVYYTDGKIYKALQTTVGNLPTNATYFSQLTTYESTVIEGNNVTAEYYDFVLVEYGKKCAAEANALWARNQDCGNCDKLKLSEDWVRKRGIVIAISTFAGLNQYSKSEELSRKLENICESC